MIDSNKDINELIEIREDVEEVDLIEVIENTLGTEEELMVETTEETLTTDLGLFYEHLLKSVIQLSRFGTSWIHSLNTSRILINKNIIKNNKINTNNYKILLSIVDDAILLGKKDAAKKIKESSLELSRKCENYPIPDYFKDIEGFVFNSQKIKAFILEEQRKNKDFNLSKSQLLANEILLDKELDDIILGKKGK